MMLPNAVFNKTQAATVLIGFYFTKSHKIGTSTPLPAPVSKGNTAAIQMKTRGGGGGGGGGVCGGETVFTLQINKGELLDFKKFS